MIDVAVEVNERQLAATNRKLERFARAMQDPTPANRQASIALYGWTLRNFNAKGAMQGGWVPLHPRTVKQKARIGKEQMLVRSGALRSNFTQFYSADNAGVGNELSYSKYHHFGTSRLPQRKLLPDRRHVLEIGLKVYGLYVKRQSQVANT